MEISSKLRANLPGKNSNELFVYSGNLLFYISLQLHFILKYLSVSLCSATVCDSDGTRELPWLKAGVDKFSCALHQKYTALLPLGSRNNSKLPGKMIPALKRGKWRKPFLCVPQGATGHYCVPSSALHTQCTLIPRPHRHSPGPLPSSEKTLFHSSLKPKQHWLAKIL